MINCKCLNSQINLIRKEFYLSENKEYQNFLDPSVRQPVEYLDSSKMFKKDLYGGQVNTHFDLLQQRNQGIPLFCNEYQIPNAEIKRLIDNIEADKTAETHLLEILPYLSVQLLPTILMYCYQRGKSLTRPVLSLIETLCLKNEHHLNFDNLIILNFVTHFVKPYGISLSTKAHYRNAVLKQELAFSLEDYQKVLFSLRRDKKLATRYNLLLNCIKRGEEFGLDKDAIKVVDLLYAFAVSKPNKIKPEEYVYFKKHNENIIENFSNILCQQALTFDLDYSVRLAYSLYLLKIDETDLFINRVERNFYRNAASAKTYHVSEIFRALRFINDNKGGGSDKFFNFMEKIVLDRLKEFEFHEVCSIAAAYSERKSGTKEFIEKLEDYFMANIEKAATFADASCLGGFLLYNQSENVALWKGFIGIFEKLDYKLPVIYYKNIKRCLYYLEAIRPDLELFYLRDSVFYAEQLFNYFKKENEFDEEKRNQIVFNNLTERIHLKPIPYVVIENVAIVHFAFPHKKLSLNVYYEKDYVNKSAPLRLKPEIEIEKKILEAKGWLVLAMSWDEYLKIGDQDARDEFVWNWYKTSEKVQEEKGIAAAVPKYFV